MKQTIIKIILTISFGMVLITPIRAQTSESLAQKKAWVGILNNQAVDLIDAEKFDGAIKLLRETIGLRSHYAIAYGNLGAAFYGAGFRNLSSRSPKRFNSNQITPKITATSARFMLKPAKQKKPSRRLNARLNCILISLRRTLISDDFILD